MTKLEAYVISLKANGSLIFVEASHRDLWQQRIIGSYDAFVMDKMSFDINVLLK